MSWNIVPECISTVFLCIIWVYSRKGNLIPSVKNRLFQASLVTTFLAMTTNILSTVLLHWLTPQTLLLTWAVTLVYFVATPLMGLVYFLYTAANIYADTPGTRGFLLLWSLPGMAYLVLVLATPFFHCLFNITLQQGYMQGRWIAATYLVFYFYCIACVGLVTLRGNRIDPSIRAILFSFPAIAGVVIVIQLAQPAIILSGSAATCAILIIYLYLQNKQISIDYLTHLPNRYELLRMLEVCLRRKRPFSIVVLSLCNFKDVNDTHGQQSGDYLLAALSNYLRRELRLREGEIYRYSGDEFALLLHSENEAVLQPMLQRMLDRMRQPWSVTGCTCLLSAAIGIVNYPKTSDGVAGLINGLEYAVTCAKADTGSYPVCHCTPELLNASKRRHLVAQELAANLQSGGFAIYYQPIFSVQSGQFRSAEALLRMPSAQLDGTTPDEFIPVAEETGMIIEITYLVLDKVCAYLRCMMDRGLAPDSISVNFSTLQFRQPDTLTRVLEILERHRVPCSKIKIEVTESILAADTEMITAYLHQFNEQGIRVGLDDFGTGYSNLIAVLGLPIDTVKLDKSLVWSAVKNARRRIAVQNFARAFHELGMTVLAEGVETEEQQQFVVDAGCTLIQGYFYARPMPEQAFTDFLEQNSTVDSTQAQALT